MRIIMFILNGRFKQTHLNDAIVSSVQASISCQTIVRSKATLPRSSTHEQEHMIYSVRIPMQCQFHLQTFNPENQRFIFSCWFVALLVGWNWKINFFFASSERHGMMILSNEEWKCLRSHANSRDADMPGRLENRMWSENENSGAAHSGTACSANKWCSRFARSFKKVHCKLLCFCFARKHPIGNRFLMRLWVCLIFFQQK